MNDREFIAQAVKDGMTEAELGRLGAAQALDARIKELGRRMMEEHERANRELVRLAKQKRLEIPTEMDREQRGIIDDLKGMSGEDFHRAYLRAVVRDHQKCISVFLQESHTGADEELKSFADRLLPVLADHFRTARLIAE